MCCTNNKHFRWLHLTWVQTGVCISRPLALCLAFGPGPQFCVYQFWPPICIYRTWPQFVFTGPGSQFVFTGPSLQFCYQSGAWVCICQTCLLNLYLYLPPYLAYDLYYRSRAWIYIYLIIGSSSSGSSKTSSSNFFGTNNTNICMPILVN